MQTQRKKNVLTWDYWLLTGKNEHICIICYNYCDICFLSIAQWQLKQSNDRPWFGNNLLSVSLFAFHFEFLKILPTNRCIHCSLSAGHHLCQGLKDFSLTTHPTAAFNLCSIYVHQQPVCITAVCWHHFSQSAFPTFVQGKRRTSALSLFPSPRVKKVKITKSSCVVCVY